MLSLLESHEQTKRRRMTKNKLRISARAEYKFQWIEDKTNGYLIIFAIVQNEVWKGKVHEELMFAEIIPGVASMKDCHQIKWEDDFFNAVITTSLSEAKKHVLDNYKNHIPHSNGKVFDKD